MIVKFDNLKDYIDELREVRGRSIVVRATIDTLEINDGLSRVTVKSGFVNEPDFCSACIDCGDNPVGRNWSGPGIDAAKKVIEELKQECERLGHNLRGGEFELA